MAGIPIQRSMFSVLEIEGEGKKNKKKKQANSAKGVKKSNNSQRVQEVYHRQ